MEVVFKSPFLSPIPADGSSSRSEMCEDHVGFFVMLMPRSLKLLTCCSSAPLMETQEEPLQSPPMVLLTWSSRLFARLLGSSPHEDSSQFGSTVSVTTGLTSRLREQLVTE